MVLDYNVSANVWNSKRNTLKRWKEDIYTRLSDEEDKFAVTCKDMFDDNST